MSDDLLNQLKTPGPTPTQSWTRRNAIPDGWQPRLDIDEVDGGTLTSAPFEAGSEPDHADLLADFGLAPEDWTVERVRRSRWQVWDESWRESVRLSLLPRSATAASGVDMDALAETIEAWRPATPVAPSPRTAGTFVHPWGDIQWGKAKEPGGGSGETLIRVLAEIESGVNRKALLEERRGQFEQVALPQLGDCVEGVSSQGGNLTARLDMTITEQVRVYRRLLWSLIRSYAEDPDTKILVPVVPGNHDEAYRRGNMMASVHSDSWAVDAASAVQDAVGENRDLVDRVQFVFPGEDELTVCLDLSGTTVGIMHGHAVGGSGWGKWWDEQAGGRQPIGDVDLLLAGHFHTLVVNDHGQKTFMQIPALDGGSNHYKHRRGKNTRPRTVTFWTADGTIHDLDPVN